MNYKGTDIHSIDKMKYYEFQTLTKILREHLEKINEQHEKSNAQADNMKKSMPKMGNMNMPKFNSPKFK